ncbi:mannose-1-phosphate guanylyltransferase/mannose-6-phosphate isomerase [Pseudomonas sp. GD03944]|uniref:mannose-1-phosphate guanylyltransferase/mannose-6-phosphate isomerase n=1 Tax=Pseudomonas sp. GD03944 TaxID=2975409 RepID=UPI0024481D29|nr:mannose-1-phosphate guanylyltransferase/mannose-6-phosphate isomerase [Pseudomonas sp. GD03944]MDH1262579.1 mannose-1-phosphate guanylyltransferase/mannose-6-phosphate isomerase [Pseudomonas sp. GD03944]
MKPATPVQPVVLCGGAGTRLWPLSRAGFPKQFLSLVGNDSLFQQSIKRLLGVGEAEASPCMPYIVCNEEHRFLAQEQLRELRVDRATFLLEPNGRNTAPALTLAALAARDAGDDPVLVVTPADQAINDDDAFCRAVRQAVESADKGNIVILGITPDKPETGYGYIKVSASEEAVAAVERFVEKPDRDTAQAYLDEGGYYWNAGLFVLKASVWLQALESFRPDIFQATLAAWANKRIDGAFIRPESEAFSAIPSESVDYAVMEKCPGSSFPIKMVPLDAGWSDLGAWDAVWNVSPKEEGGNALKGDVLITESRNSLVHANSRLVALVGVENLVVIETADAVLVADRSRCQEVKQIVSLLNQQSREELSLHRKVHRPWGWYDSIDEGGRFKVKRIQVNPKASLSLQKHHHRAEHWVVVQGTAEITRGSETLLLSENQSTYIPLGDIHRLSNPGSIPLEIIEVQSGSYLGEDDIVRFDDQYGRSH